MQIVDHVCMVIIMDIYSESGTWNFALWYFNAFVITAMIETSYAVNWRVKCSGQTKKGGDEVYLELL